MDLKLFEFLDQFMIETFCNKMNPMWENWINRQTFIPLGNLNIKIHFRN